MRLAQSIHAVIALAALVAGPAVAAAQSPVVSPRGDQAPEPGPGPDPYGQPQPQQEPAPAEQGEQGEEGEVVDEGYYHLDDLDLGRDDRGFGDQEGQVRGPVPEVHVVRKGDTLWDISALYFNDPWRWPRIWSLNPNITNPHWIYPGDLVRLLDAEEVAVADEPVQSGDVDIDRPPRRDEVVAVTLRQLAFVEKADLEDAMRVVGSPEEKMMLSTNDGAYLEYPEGKPPASGERYMIYSEQTPVRHPDSGEEVGSYVKVLGEVRIHSLHEGTKVRANIIQAYDVIERGALVGPVERTFHKVEPTANAQDLRGTIIGQLTTDMVSQDDLVIVDLGAEQGVQEGNRLYVIRSGDAYAEVMDPSGNVGQDDADFPPRALGEIIIVQVGQGISIGLVTLSLQELGVGDHVLMTRGR